MYEDGYVRHEFKIIAVFLITVLVAGCISNSNTDITKKANSSVTNTGYTFYVNQSYGVSLYYPEDWAVQNQPYNKTVFYGPKNVSTGDNDFSVTLKYDNSLTSTRPVTLDIYTAFAVMAPRHDNPLSHVKDISWNNTTIDGYPAIEYLYTDIQNNTSIKGLLAYTVTGNIHYYDTANKEWAYAGKAYTIEYTAKEYAFDVHIGEVQHLINSLTFSD